jgi:hypothetical protein
MEIKEDEIKGKPYKFKYTLKRYNRNESFLDDGKIIFEQNSLDGFLEEILKNSDFVYSIYYPCEEGHINFNNFTGRWALNIGSFIKKKKLKKTKKELILKWEKEIKTVETDLMKNKCFNLNDISLSAALINKYLIFINDIKELSLSNDG